MRAAVPDGVITVLELIVVQVLGVETEPCCLTLREAGLQQAGIDFVP